MDVYNVLTLLIDRGVKLSVVDGQLKAAADPGVITSELVGLIKSNKEELIRIVQRKSAVAIPRAPEKEHYQLSSAQWRLYFLFQLDKESTAYNMPKVVRLEGSVDTNRLETTFRQLIDRHESLRTQFVLVNDEPVQKILPVADFKLEQFEAAEAEIPQFIEQFIRPFDLHQDLLIRAGVIRVENGDHVLMVDVHHIISDGVSQNILIEEFNRLFQGEELPVIELQYKDFTEWQQSSDQKQVKLRDKDFWLNEYAEEVSPLNLPLDHNRPLNRSFDGDEISVSLDSQTLDQLKELCEQEGTSTFVALLSVYSVLLSKLSNQEDIVIGTPVAGRQHADLDRMIGMFVNTVPLRSRPANNKTFRAFLREVHGQTLSCFDHQAFQYEDLIDELKVPRNTSRNPLFDVMFAHQNVESSILGLAETEVSALDNGHQISKFDLGLITTETEGRLILQWQFVKSLFDRSSIQRFTVLFDQIMRLVLADPDGQLGKLDYISTDEKKLILEEFNATTRDFPEDKTILDLLDEQVKQTPEKEALVFEGVTLSYQEFYHRVNGVAQMLQDKGIQPGSVVGVLLDRSFELVISIYGILKAGAAYVPVDVEFPQERIDYILSDSKASYVLTSSKYDKLVDENIERFYVDAKSVTEIKIEVKSQVSPSALAYTIYTSGSTGRPKGVGVRHDSLTNLLYTLQRHYPLIGTDKFLLKTNHVFDVSVAELFSWVLGGGSLVILPQEAKADTEKMLSLIAENEVTHLNFVPSMFSIFLDTLDMQGTKSLDSLKYIFLAGEALPPAQVQRFATMGTNIQLENIYGPTEATVYSSNYSIDVNQVGTTIPIGKPLDNVVMLVLNEHHFLQPIGVPNELYIGGKGLSAGYINNAEQTASKFVSNPFIRESLMYRTGDVARWLPDGNLQYLGRIDDQVKIRGYRIELGEIAHQLSAYESIKEALVLVKGEAGDRFLVGYYVSEAPIKESELKEYLMATLPEYMVPSNFVHLIALPVTANGKVDKKALPEVIWNAGEAYEPAATEMESQLVDIWSNVLKREADQISVTRSFFDLGGHSFRAITMVNQLAQLLEVKVTLKDVFLYQDIRSLAVFIQKLDGNTTLEKISPAEKKAHYIASPAQRRMYILNQINQTSLAYNMPRFLKLTGEVDTSHLKAVFTKLIDRHEALRTSFHDVEQELVQKITSHTEFELEIHSTDRLQLEQHFTRFIRPFDLEKAPLIRAGLLQVIEADTIVENYLMVDIHHIVTDGASQVVLIQDFISLYNNEQLCPLQLHYKDYSEWYRSQSVTGEISRQRQFWLSQFEEELEALDLPTDYPRPQTRSLAGNSIAVELNEDLTHKIKAIAKEEGATAFMVLLAAFNVVLAKLTNSPDVIVGTPVGGRQHAALEKMVGVFINTLPLRNRPQGEKTFNEFLAEVKSNTLSALENQHYPFEELVEELELKRDTSRNPLFDCLFAYQNFDQVTDQMEGLDVETISFDHRISKFDWTLTVIEGEDSILLNSNYASDLFKEETIRQFVTYLERTLEQVLTNREVKIGSVKILSAEEEHELLHEFNQPAVDQGEKQTLLAWLAHSVEFNPENTALVHRDQSLTYTELDRLSDKLAYHLLSSKITGQTIGLLCERSVEQIIGLIGILKAGYSYLPLDPDQPLTRISQLVGDCQVSAVLTNKDLGFTREGVDFIDVDSLLNSEVDAIDLPEIKPTDVAYIIYTSGSTGQPKGVLVPHKAATNLIISQSKTFGIDATDRILQFSPLIFDPSVEQTWMAFGNGAALVLIDKDTIADPVAFEKYVVDQDITHLHGTPSFLENINLSEANQVRRIVSGGEPCSVALAEKFATRFDFFNKYGPTEATITSTVHRVFPDQIDAEGIPIGKAVDNTRLYVLDEARQLQPKGIKGELYIGGFGVANGYVGNEQATAEKFLPDPFKSGGRMYKTGDLVKWRSDGTLHFFGRVDDQVKVRGFRIEPGEISHHLNAFDGIESATVLVKGEGHDRYLVGYYVAPASIDRELIHGFLSDRLPKYMVPDLLVHLERMPLTVNGKIDKRALPDPTINHLTREKPKDEVEAVILSIWSEVLKINQEVIGVTNSFYELGGHSLRAMLALNKVNQQYGIEMDLRTFFTRPTIREMADFVKFLKPAGSSGEEVHEEEQFTI